MQRPLSSDDADTEPWLLVGAPSFEAEDADAEAADPAAQAAPDDRADGTTSLPLSLNADALAARIRRIVEQDETALAELYDALCGRVYACALRITRQVAAAEEVMQDTFWQVWRQAPRFDPQRGTAPTWVLAIARSRALDHVRRLQRDRLHAHELAQTDADPMDDDPQDLLAGLQIDARLHQLLARLDPLKRQLVALAYYRGLTHDEIALHTGMPLGTVKSLLRRTLMALRDALGADGGPAADTRT